MDSFDYTAMPDYASVHNKVETCSEADEILANIISVYESGINAINSSYISLQKTAVDEKLKGAKLSKINNGINVSSLECAGINSVYDLIHCQTPETFRQLTFADSAALQSRAKILEQAWRDRFSLKIEPDSNDQDVTTIVATIAQLMVVEPYYKEAKQLYNATHLTLAQAIPLADRNPSQIVWLLHYGMNMRHQIWDSIHDIEEIANSDILNQAKKLKDECNAAIDQCWKKSYWEWFEINAAQFYAFLESIVGRPKSETSALGFNYNSDKPLDAISGESTSTSQEQEHSSVDLGIPDIPPYSSDPELADLEKRADSLVKSVNSYNLNLSKMKSRLRGYQEFATKYILHQHQVLLGDEMGLGKTIEAIAAIAHLSACGETHFMVVCPLGVLVNWGREIDKHSRLTKWEIHGHDSFSSYYHWRRFGGVALTTYETLKKLQVPDRDFISILVVDEAHKIKNPKAQKTHAVLDFKKKSKRALFMTGTPMENKIDEMIFLTRCLRPDIANIIDIEEANANAAKFRLKVVPVYLRRTRDDVLNELPEKEEIENWCTMTETEHAEYQHSVAFDSFMSLRRLSWNLPDITYSSKAKMLLEICEDAYMNNRKVIVFSFFKDTLRVVQKILGNRAFGPITGEISSPKRQEIIDKFTNGPRGSVLVSQIEAGGVGLNIQAASVIIFCEPQWKPSVENQAISRAHRMGQTHKVFVHRLLMENTIDEYIFALLKGKAQAFELYANISESGLASLDGLKAQENFLNFEAKRLGVTRIAKTT